MIKYLVIRFSSIGDIVLTTPVIRSLKEQVEEAEVHFLTKPQFSNILENNPNVDKVHSLKESFSETISDLKEECFDYIIDLHNNIRSKRVVAKLKVMPFTFNKLNYQKWLLVNFKKNKLPDIHIVDRYLDTIKLFDTVNDKKGLDFFIPEKDNVEITSLPEKFQNGYISFVIGAMHNTKRLPTEKVASIISKINYPTILIGGPNEFEDGELIKSLVGDKVLNAVGKYNLNQSASIVKQSKVVISHDTGLMHIAAAFDKKIISIWGNTVPEFGMYPYVSEENSKLIQVEDLQCRPCSKIGFSKCPKKHFKCMMDINEEEIKKTVLKWL